MDLVRFIFCLLLLCFSSAVLAATNPNQLGVALVHGTNDHRTDAIGGYWKKDFAHYMAESVPNHDNFFVLGCDYRHFMWQEETAGCTVNQLLNFIHSRKLSKLIIYTHSNGGNVIRWILSNPTYDPRYYELSQYVSQVIAIAPSSGGTSLADDVINGNMFEESVGWLLGFRNDSVKQQRIGDMALYNDEILFGTPGRPPLMVPFRVVVGTDVTASPFSRASYCNGYLLNVGLKITKAYLNQCSDGFLTCGSQAIAGQLWFKDTQKTKDKIALSHNQSRHSCFGLGEILRNDLKAQGVA